LAAHAVPRIRQGKFSAAEGIRRHVTGARGKGKPISARVQNDYHVGAKKRESGKWKLSSKTIFKKKNRKARQRQVKQTHNKTKHPKKKKRKKKTQTPPAPTKKQRKTPTKKKPKTNQKKGREFEGIILHKGGGDGNRLGEGLSVGPRGNKKWVTNVNSAHGRNKTQNKKCRGKRERGSHCATE